MKHGRGGYNKGCRCVVCATANSNHTAAFRKANPDYVREYQSDQRANNSEHHRAIINRSNRKAYARRKAAAIAQLGGQCARCASTDNLEFDHIDPSTKDINPSTYFGKGGVKARQAREAELKKCQLLCHDCHVEKTRANGEYNFKRGTE